MLISTGGESVEAMPSGLEDDLTRLGITQPAQIIYNPSYEALFVAESVPDLTRPERGDRTTTGAISVQTGVYTGRSPKDRYLVCEPDTDTEKNIWWSTPQSPNDNRPITPQVWGDLKKNVTDQLSGKKLFVIDGLCGADETSCLRVRFIVEVAWQAHFVKNMFIRLSREQLATFKPDFVVLNGAKTSHLDFADHGLNSPTFIAFNLRERIQIIGGTWYGGEMKKGLFSVMNYLLPARGIAPMHCAANVGSDDDVALFFGLSGTGKTTLSTDPKRALIGDDEHGWDDRGVFNFEGGCYAKTADLDPEKEPDIYRAIRRNALLENVWIDDQGQPDYSNTSLTENGRVSYPIEHIANIVPPPSRAGHAQRIIFLSADAFGVLPCVSCLDEEQAQYHFLSGFTSKMSGTERGVTRPIPVFSACFGEAFLLRHPTAYGEVLAKRMQASGAKAYLVNTGWDGHGQRLPLQMTRAIIDAILSGAVDDAHRARLPFFHLDMPTSLPGVKQEMLDPRLGYRDAQMWQTRAQDLAQLFINNFERFTDTARGRALSASGPTQAP